MSAERSERCCGVIYRKSCVIMTEQGSTLTVKASLPLGSTYEGTNVQEVRRDYISEPLQMTEG